MDSDDGSIIAPINTSIVKSRITQLGFTHENHHLQSSRLPHPRWRHHPDRRVGWWPCRARSANRRSGRPFHGKWLTPTAHHTAPGWHRRHGYAGCGTSGASRPAQTHHHRGTGKHPGHSENGSGRCGRSLHPAAGFSITIDAGNGLRATRADLARGSAHVCRPAPRWRQTKQVGPG